MTPSDRIAQLEAELETARRDADNDHAIVKALRAEGFDPFRNEVTICGVRYSIDLFETLGVGAVGDVIRIEKREGETLTVRRLSGREVPS